MNFDIASMSSVYWLVFLSVTAGLLTAVHSLQLSKREAVDAEQLHEVCGSGVPVVVRTGVQVPSVTRIDDPRFNRIQRRLQGRLVSQVKAQPCVKFDIGHLQFPNIGDYGRCDMTGRWLARCPASMIVDLTGLHPTLTGERLSIYEKFEVYVNKRRVWAGWLLDGIWLTERLPFQHD